MTKNATEFVSPKTFESLSHRPVVVDTFQKIGTLFPASSCFPHNSSQTLLTMSAGSCILPVPISPQASLPLIGSITLKPSVFKITQVEKWDLLLQTSAKGVVQTLFWLLAMSVWICQSTQIALKLNQLFVSTLNPAPSFVTSFATTISAFLRCNLLLIVKLTKYLII